jgi:hypothetical protein
MRTIFRALLGSASLLASGVALAACGGGSGASSTSTSASATAQQRAVAAVTQFAGCLRQHGIPVPDPNSQGQVSGSQQLQQEYRNTPQGQAALNACRSYLRAASTLLTPVDMQQYRHAQLLFARCMRAHGIAVPDPGPDGEIQLNPQTVNRSSPQFQSAVKACAYLRRNGPGPQFAIGG